MEYQKFQKLYFFKIISGLSDEYNFIQIIKGFITTDDFEADQTLFTNISSESNFQLKKV